jgi:hypothetical protein
LLAVLLGWLGFSSYARGQERVAERPPDVLELGTPLSALPAVPSDFVEERRGQVTWAYAPSATSLVEDLARELPSTWQRITRELGADVSGELTIRVARGPKDMVRLSPNNAPPPGYAVGVAYPARGLIILSVVDPQSWLPPNLESVLTHELSHIALHRAVEGRALPLWFVEGMAIHQAEEQGLTRIRTLWEASVADQLLPLSELSRAFPARPEGVNLAYAQSADIVRHMLKDRSDRARLPGLLSRVAKGEGFEKAVLSSYYVDLPYLEREWRTGLHERFHVTPLLLSGSFLWVGIAVLAVFAFVRRRRDQRRKLERWADEEAQQERALAALSMQRQVEERGEQATRAGLVVAQWVREPGVPTIEHDGQQHTLH